MNEKKSARKFNLERLLITTIDLRHNKYRGMFLKIELEREQKSLKELNSNEFVRNILKCKSRYSLDK